MLRLWSPAKTGTRAIIIFLITLSSALIIFYFITFLWNKTVDFPALYSIKPFFPQSKTYIYLVFFICLFDLTFCAVEIFILLENQTQEEEEMYRNMVIDSLEEEVQE